jgi:hypothetical protein
MSFFPFKLLLVERNDFKLKSLLAFTSRFHMYNERRWSLDHNMWSHTALHNSSSMGAHFSGDGGCYVVVQFPSQFFSMATVSVYA